MELNFGYVVVISSAGPGQKIAQSYCVDLFI
jgi:hypothetical protein